MKRTDGQTAGTLVGTHGAQGAGQSVFYQSGDITYRGELRRP